MATRTFLHLGDTASRCVFTSVQYYKPKLHTLPTCRQIRNFKNLKDTGTKSATPFPNVYVEKGPIHFTKLWKPFAFTVVFSGTTFVAAAIWEYERIRDRTYKMLNRYRQIGIHRPGWRSEMQVWWNNLTEGQRVFAPICFLNVMVFLAWRLPRLQQIMVRYFCANPSSSVTCWPMLLSTFSHYSFLHLAANMYVLHSFISIAVSTLGKEQFVAFYLTSGVVSSFASHLYKAAFSLQSASLGASGAVMGILGFVCTQYPDTHLAIILLPMYTFSAGTAIKAIVGLDVVGCILRWKYFDHAAHLGGALFGMFWQAWGNANIWQKREPVLTLWRDIRGPPRPH